MFCLGFVVIPVYILDSMHPYIYKHEQQTDLGSEGSLSGVSMGGDAYASDHEGAGAGGGLESSFAGLSFGQVYI